MNYGSIKKSGRKRIFIQRSGYSVCLVNEHNKTVTPVHGYYPPHPTAKYIKKLADKLGYEFISY